VRVTCSWPKGVFKGDAPGTDNLYLDGKGKFATSDPGGKNYRKGRHQTGCEVVDQKIWATKINRSK